MTNNMSRRQDYEKTRKIKNRANCDNRVLFVAYLQENILERLLLKIQKWTLINLKKLFLIESNGKRFAIKNDAIRNFFDSITSFRVQSSEKFRIFSSIEIRETFDKMSKYKCISNKMSVICALLKHSIEVLFKSNKKSLDMIVVVKQTLRKRDAFQNTKFVKRTRRREKSFSNTTFRDVDKLSLFCFKNTIDDYENFELRNVIQNVFKQNLIFKAFSLKLQNVFKILQKINFFVVRIRSLAQKASIKQRKNENDRKNLKSTLLKIRKTIDSISNQKWYLKNEILC